MKRLSAWGLIGAGALALVIGHSVVVASAGGSPSPRGSADSEFSPLYARRLDASIRNMDRPVDRFHTASLEYDPHDEPVEGGIASAQPLSFCIGSLCYASGCLGSACIGSACLGSACSSSQCTGSTCFGSVCGGSACLGSTCVGSACLGSVCLGSACLNCPKV